MDSEDKSGFLMDLFLILSLRFICGGGKKGEPGNTIKENYKVTLKEELLEVLDQITASVLGRIYGEVYASCMLNGKICSELEDFIKPYRKGV